MSEESKAALALAALAQRAARLGVSIHTLALIDERDARIERLERALMQLLGGADRRDVLKTLHPQKD